MTTYYYCFSPETQPGLSPAESTKPLVVRPPWTAIIIIMYKPKRLSRLPSTVLLYTSRGDSRCPTLVTIITTTLLIIKYDRWKKEVISHQTEIIFPVCGRDSQAGFSESVYCRYRNTNFNSLNMLTTMFKKMVFVDTSIYAKRGINWLNMC